MNLAWPDQSWSGPTWPDLAYLRSGQGPTWPNGRDATGLAFSFRWRTPLNDLWSTWEKCRAIEIDVLRIAVTVGVPYAYIQLYSFCPMSPSFSRCCSPSFATVGRHRWITLLGGSNVPPAADCSPTRRAIRHAGGRKVLGKDAATNDDQFPFIRTMTIRSSDSNSWSIRRRLVLTAIDTGIGQFCTRS